MWNGRTVKSERRHNGQSCGLAEHKGCITCKSDDSWNFTSAKQNSHRKKAI